MSVHNNLVNRVFGRLTAMEPAGKSKHNVVIWRCVCECGAQVLVPRGSLCSGNTKSCGCLRREVAARLAFTHGQKGTRTYRIWGAMKKRCTNPRSSNYANYGGRGITVCERWQSFEAFLEDMGEAPEGMSLNRRDNNKGYSPENCCWATAEEQNRNRRNSRILAFMGKAQCAATWAEELGLPSGVIRERIDKLGWSIEDALTIPSWGTKRGRTRKTVAAPEQVLYKQDISPSDTA